MKLTNLTFDVYYKVGNFLRYKGKFHGIPETAVFNADTEFYEHGSFIYKNE